MQWNVVSNISKINGAEITCITIPPYAVFPHEKRIIHKRNVVFLNEKIKSINIGFLNFPIIKQFTQIHKVYRELKKYIKDNPDCEILAFNMFPQVGTPLRWIKKKYPKNKINCLLADLPIDNSVKRKGMSSFLRRMFDKETLKNMQICDKYIVLNENVIEKYFPNKQYIVVDGGVSEEDISKTDIKVEKCKEKNVLFCGALSHYNGIENLLDAFDLLKGKDIFLDIYGGGYLEQEVRNRAENNKNIRFFGSVLNEIALKKQMESWLLINPRIVDDPISQVTFPSKTFEYLLSGTPILTTRLNGYTSEYEKVMFFLPSDKPEIIADEIYRLSLTDEKELKKVANEARLFGIREKNWAKQAKRIYDFIIN